MTINPSSKIPPGATIGFTAIKTIFKDQEITVNYNFGNPNDKTKLWISDIPEAGDL